MTRHWLMIVVGLSVLIAMTVLAWAWWDVSFTVGKAFAIALVATVFRSALRVGFGEDVA